jgi:hypothetical protein
MQIKVYILATAFSFYRPMFRHYIQRLKAAARAAGAGIVASGLFDKLFVAVSIRNTMN